jgi:hypothetical protein
MDTVFRTGRDAGDAGEKPALDLSEEAVARLVSILTPEQCLRLHAMLVKREAPWATDVCLTYRVPGHSERSVVALPAVGGGEGDDDEPEDAITAGILRALKRSPFAVTRKQLALACGRKGPNGSRGRWGQVVSRLADTGKIFKRGDLYADDASKFPDDD